MAQRRIEPERRMKILADYAMEGSYRAAARKNGVSPDTVGGSCWRIRRWRGRRTRRKTRARGT